LRIGRGRNIANLSAHQFTAHQCYRSLHARFYIHDLPFGNLSDKEHRAPVHKRNAGSSNGQHVACFNDWVLHHASGIGTNLGAPQFLFRLCDRCFGRIKREFHLVQTGFGRKSLFYQLAVCFQIALGLFVLRLCLGQLQFAHSLVDDADQIALVHLRQFRCAPL